MRLSRFYINKPLVVGQKITLPKELSHYLVTVLRLRIGVIVTLFNGQGGEYQARLVAITQKIAQLQIEVFHAIERESRLSLTLVQAISRPEHMDYTIQKAVELGVHQIVPVITERTPPLNPEILNKRQAHWHQIMLSACEQCGRNRLVQFTEIMPLTTWLAQVQSGRCIVLSPHAHNTLFKVIQSAHTITLLVGAEGGLSEMEIQQAIQAGYQDIQLGPRILRTETAATAILAICQAWQGDLR
ncbi:MAG: 16S rRNA (uracil(1498)-N(3))-methyltransferase [Thioploca sp.]|nr:16S rRNA (uracil(1498)-N(3))-methyltransferase [Thioploca sp.]